MQGLGAEKMCHIAFQARRLSDARRAARCTGAGRPPARGLNDAERLRPGRWRSLRRGILPRRTALPPGRWPRRRFPARKKQSGLSRRPVGAEGAGFGPASRVLRSAGNSVRAGSCRSLLSAAPSRVGSPARSAAISSVFSSGLRRRRWPDALPVEGAEDGRGGQVAVGEARAPSGTSPAPRARGLAARRGRGRRRCRRARRTPRRCRRSAATSHSSCCDSPGAHSSLQATSAAAASALPPAIPPATGMRLRSPRRRRPGRGAPSRAARAQQPGRRGARRLSPSCGTWAAPSPLTVTLSASAADDGHLVEQRDRVEHGHQAVVAVRRAAARPRAAG